MNPPIETPAAERDSRPFLIALLFMTLASFWPVGEFGFIGYDDYDYVYQNVHVKAGLTSDSVAWAFDSATAGNWHPLTWLSLMLDCELFGADPQEEHWVNVGFHAANALLLFLFLRRLTGARWRSFFVAALFACHPLHVQSVAWISERKDVLSGFFGILTLMAYVRYCRSKIAVDYGLILVLFILGLMAKPMLVTLPAIMLLLDFWPLNRVPAVSSPGSFLHSSRGLLIEKIPLFVLGLASSAVTIWAQNSGGAVTSLQTVPLPDRCLHAVVSYVLYLGKLFWPANLAIFYPLPHGHPAVLAWLGSLLLLAAITFVAFRRRQSQPYLLTGWLWFLVMLVPVIGLLQVGLQSMADRYTYLPAIGLFIIVAWGMAEIAGTAFGKRGMAGLGTILVAACMMDTRHQLGFWSDNITLFQHVVAVTPENNYLGYFYLGISQAETGDMSAAERCLKLSLLAEPEFAMAKQRLGNVLLVEKKYGEAEPWLREIVQMQPQDALAHVTLGMALAGEQKYAEAQPEYETARRLMPGNEAVERLLTANAPKAQIALTLAGLMEQAKTNPTERLHVQMAVLDEQLDEYPVAVSHYEQALGLDTNSVEALNDLAWLLATCPDASLRNGPQAVKLAERASELTGFQTTTIVGTLAAAQAEAGHFDDAIATAQRACANAAAKNETNSLKANEGLLRLYQAHQAYHRASEPADANPAEN